MRKYGEESVKEEEMGSRGGDRRGRREDRRKRV